jgi:hypothetical protein
VPGRFLTSLVAVPALALICATSAAAVEISFDGEVLRLRGREDEFVDGVVELRAHAEPPYFLIRSVLDPSSVQVRLGCHKASGPPGVDVRCPLVSVPNAQLRYRFTLGRGDITFYKDLTGVVYAGSSRDVVVGGDRVYGGAGADLVEDAARVYAGPGRDQIYNDVAHDVGFALTKVAHGGPGNDLLLSGGLIYGGAGADHLSDRFARKSGDMLVGGPGRDTVELVRDRRSDVVRVRGGDVDRVRCPTHPDPGDALFVDRSDRLSPSCENARVLFTGRPRYPYP